MNNKLREEVLAAIQRAIGQGFENEDEIFESTFEMFCREDVDGAWFRRQLSEACYYHSQDIDHAIEGNQLWIGFGDFDEDQARKKTIGKVVAHWLRQGGLRIAWNEDPEQRILVTGIVWRKRHDDLDFSYARAIAHLV